MPKLCEFENCKNRASYGKYFGKPLRCKTHKENYKQISRVCLCGKVEPSFGYENEKSKCCYSCKYNNMINLKNINKKCKCGTNCANFNYSNEKIALYCSKCKKDGMVDIKHKKCKCDKARPTFGFEKDKIPLCCVKCKEINMINVISKSCLCGKSQPCFNYPNEIIPIYCYECKKDNMINIKTKKCLCGKSQPRFNFKDKKKPLFCKTCKKDNMIDVLAKKCECGKKRPTYNYSQEKEAICCLECKTNSMVNVISKKCICGKARPTFNFNIDQSPICCKICKKINMIDVVNNKCKCGKAVARFNYKTEQKPLYCSNCKLDGMVNITDKMCKGPNCDTYGNKKYKGYCTHCFSHLFPKDPLTFQINCKTKEIAVRDFINTNYNGFTHDKSLWVQGCDCTHKRRIDHRKLISNTLLCIETDENQHMSYSKQDEINRYHDCYMVLSAKMIFIRFNPDKYTNSKNIRKNPTMGTRLQILKNEINKQILRIENEENTDLLEIIKLFYNDYD